MHKKHKKGRLRSVTEGVCLILLSAVCVLPFLWMCGKIRIKDFYLLLIEEFWFYPKYWYSLGIAAVIGTGAAVLSFLAAVGLQWGNIKGKKAILFLVLLLMLMPLQATLLPTYIGLRDMHMLNSPFALILPMLCSPFAFYLMYQYVETVPTEIVEAARLETSSLCKILWHALLPQVKGSVAAVFVFMFAEGFNMVEQPLYFVKEDVLRPLSVIAEEYIQGKEQLLYAVGVLCLIPILLLYAVYEEELSDGMGRLKG